MKEPYNRGRIWRDRHLQIITYWRAEGKFSSIATMADDLFSQDRDREYKSIQQLTNFMSYYNDRTEDQLDELVNIGIIPKLLQLSTIDDMPRLRLEASSVLKNIVLTDLRFARILAESDHVPTLVNILTSAASTERLKENAASILCNIFHVSRDVCESIINSKALQAIALIILADPLLRTSVKRMVAAALASLCKWQIQLTEEVETFGALRTLMIDLDRNTASHARWALYYICSVDMHSVINGGFIELFTEVLRNWSVSLERDTNLDLFLSLERDTNLDPILFTLIDISASYKSFTNSLIKRGILPRLYGIVNCPKALAEEVGEGIAEDLNESRKRLKGKACWVLMNITAGYQHHIQAVIEANIFGPLIRLLQENDEFDITSKGVGAILNAISGGSHEHVRHLLDHECLQTLCDMLICPDPSILTICLQAIGKILSIGAQNCEAWHQYVDEERRIKIKDLFVHEDDDICDKAVEVYYTYLYEYDNDVIMAVNSAFYNPNDPPNVPLGGFIFQP